jgi:nucleoside-diphosphate-sugar epimerase
MNHLLCFGFGYSAASLAAQLDSSRWRITGTSRSDDGVRAIAAKGFDAIQFDGLGEIPESVTHVLSSAPPDEVGDPVLARFGTQLAHRKRPLSWAGYLSTTGVYGDHAGGWVDEDTPSNPATERGRRRVRAEEAWMALFHVQGLPVHIFRLAGIYGPGRNQLQALRDGEARCIIKPGQVFSRIHVEDIAGILLASLAHPNPGRAYNCADDEPAPPQEVIMHAAKLLGIEPPPPENFSTATLSPMARSFYAESKRVANARVKTELGYRFLYPTYREGLAALLRSLPRQRAARE